MKFRTLFVSLVIGVVSTSFLITSCHKDPIIIHKPDVVIDPCPDAFYNYSSPVTWPYRNWDCDSGCIIGCEFHETYKHLQDYYPCFNPSNPNQIAYNRYDLNTGRADNFTFDFCTGKLVNFLPEYGTEPHWGINNWILFLDGSGNLNIVRPNGDSLTKLNNAHGTSLGSDWSPSGYFNIRSGSGSKQVDMFGHTIRTFTMPYALDGGWIDDSTAFYYTRDMTNSYLYKFSLNGSISNLICSIPRRDADTLDDIDEMTPINLVYDPNNSCIYWSASRHFYRANINTGVIDKVWNGYDSIHFKHFAYSAKALKFILMTEEVDKKTHCGGTKDYSLYLMNEDGTDLRRINIPE
jgi:hypothetical protein